MRSSKLSSKTRCRITPFWRMHPCGHGKDAVPASAASWEDLKPVPPRSDGKILFSPEGDGWAPLRMLCHLPPQGLRVAWLS